VVNVVGIRARAVARVISAVFGLVLTIGPALVAHTFPHAAALQRLGAVVLGGLIAIQACRPRH
jgi:hypothetical protein